MNLAPDLRNHQSGSRPQKSPKIPQKTLHPIAPCSFFDMYGIGMDDTWWILMFRLFRICMAKGGWEQGGSLSGRETAAQSWYYSPRKGCFYTCLFFVTNWLNNAKRLFAFLTMKVKLKAWRRSSFKWWCSGWCARAARGTPRQALLAT